MNRADLDAGLDRLANYAERAAFDNLPARDDWRQIALDILHNAEWIAARRERWPDAADRAGSVISDVAGLWASADERDALFLGDRKVDES